jgi:hypothetical protein
MSEDMKPIRQRLRRPAAAKYIGSSEGFLEKAAVTGEGPPYFRLSARLVVYDVEDLDDWLAARRVRSSAEAIERKRAAVLKDHAADEDLVGTARRLALVGKRQTRAPPPIPAAESRAHSEE